MDDDLIAERLRAYLTPTSPLGPSDAAQIEDLEVAARLFDPHNKSFNTLLRRDLSVLIGRRGSGKTALLNSYKYQPFLDKRDKLSTADPRSDFRSYDVVIDVVTYKHFDDMQRAVTREAVGFRPIEAIVDEWEDLVSDYLFARLVAKDSEGRNHTHHVDMLRDYLNLDADDYKKTVRQMVWGVPLLEKIRSLIGREPIRTRVRLTCRQAMALAVEHLAETKRRALVVFDSMDEYDIGNPVFTRTLGALIRFISHFNASQERIKIKLGLPSEIYPEVQRASANPLKDLVSVDHLAWTAIELEQIAAHRFRLFLELYDPDYAYRLRNLDLNRRSDVHEFWSRFFPPAHFNRYGVSEEPLTYVLRHTQLLPRQLLMIVQKIIVHSSALTGGFREFKTEAITEAVETTEPLIASEILRAFASVYPFAEDLCKPVFANFPTVFSYDALENRWRKKARPIIKQRMVEFEMPQFGEMLIRMGIVGVGHEEKDRYYEGHFGYDSASPMNIGDGHDLCLHPIFSRQFNAAGNDKQKAVIPKGVAAVRS
jgi:hypothetical protein